VIRRLTALLLCLCCTLLSAGPPYLTDDPEPVELHHWEAYLFAMGQSSQGVRSGLAPAVEANYGAFPDVHLQVWLPMAYADGGDGPRHQGLGDAQIGVKYRFVHEADGVPQVAIYPQVQFPTGNAPEGLGSGHTRVLCPVWLQKSFGPWTTYGGGGWWRNPGQGNRDYAIWGWQVQRELGEGNSLGLEVFHQASQAQGAAATTVWNLGFELALNPHFQLVGSGGRIFQGGSGSQFYLGLRGKT
jgi:hypothetical protein